MSVEQISAGNSGAPGEINPPPQFLPANRSPETLEHDKPQPFLDEIGRPELKEVLTPGTPWVSVSMEVGVDRLPFTGGLGVLEGDKLLQAELSGIPYTALTLAYSKRWKQRLEEYYQIEDFETVTPEDLGLERIGKTSIKMIGWQGEEITKEVDICRKSFGSAQVVALYTPDLREVYYGSNDSEHRLFQQVVLGFGGQKALDSLNLSPSMIQVNESAPVFSAIAYLDKLVQNGLDFDEALAQTRKKTFFTNHTLVPAAVSNYPLDYFERLVMPNIESEQVQNWVRATLNAATERGGEQLSMLAFELAEKQNGVSKLQAKIASSSYEKIDGSRVHFEANTNGIFLKRWEHPTLLALDQKAGVVNSNFLPSHNAQQMIENIDDETVLEIQSQAKAELIEYLRGRRDQDGEPVEIPRGSKIIGWARRLASYKRPFMFLSDPEELARTLEDENLHFVMGGKVHPTDIGMKEALRDALITIHNHPVLSRRVHFVQDYDEEIGKYLYRGTDIWLNTPRKGEEACGTSSWKVIVNRRPVISVEDGGLADVTPAPYKVINGEEDIYEAIRQVSKEVDDARIALRRGKDELKAYSRTIPSGAMQEKNLNLGYRKKLPQAA